MSRWVEAATDANAECMDEFFSTLNAWLHQREQEDREYQDQDKEWIHKQEVESASKDSQ